MQHRTGLTADPVELAQDVFRDAKTVRAHRRTALKIVVIVGLLILTVLFVGALVLDWHFQLVWRYEAAALLGGSVGTAELLSRYRDAPSFVLLSAPGINYILINSAASVGAMVIILTFGWTFGASGNAAGAAQLLVAGFGSMTLFRSSLLTVKAGNDDVGIGPSSVLSIMMAASDRSADRLRAADRAGRVRAIMADVSYEKAQEPLPTVAIALMQNLSPADVAALNADLDALNSASLPDDTKALLLGLKITNVVSTAVLAAAKESLGGSILVSPERDSREDTETDLTEKGAQSPIQTDGNTATVQETAQMDPDTSPAVDQGSASKGLPQTPQTPTPDHHSAVKTP